MWWVFTLPVMILNAFGGLTAAVWLIVIGQWKIVLVATAAVIITTLFSWVPMLLVAALNLPALLAISKGWHKTAILLAIPGNVCIAGYMGLYAYLSFFQSLDAWQPGESITPYVLLGYSVATSPWVYLASREVAANAGQPEASALVTYGLCVGCMLSTVALLFFPSYAVVSALIVVPLLIALLFGVALAVLELRFQ